ncbi:kinase-like protein [Thozetella sp. PMI_491]|nr:kinase-like protein [Thozetella sp. PMI_491]
MANAVVESQFAPPQVLTYPASTPPSLISQGAEGRLYKTTYLAPELPCALKYRPSKPYRHPILDARLTRARILAEARVLAKCRRDGVLVPAVYAVDETAGWLMMEWVEGAPVRKCINEWLGERPKTRDAAVPAADHGEMAYAEVTTDQAPLADLMRRIGSAVGKLHRAGVVHGDLTTSNMMLRPRHKDETGTGHTEGQDKGRFPLDGDIVVIDFGLATQSASEEDRAVDLYVLERAFGSTHPRAEDLFEQVLQGYSEAFKQAGPVLKKLADVRMRGRKRSMLG